jgi:hypothetical protein
MPEPSGRKRELGELPNSFGARCLLPSAGGRTL